MTTNNEFRILSPTAILGYGFPEETFRRGISGRIDRLRRRLDRSGPLLPRQRQVVHQPRALVNRDLQDSMLVEGLRLGVPSSSVRRAGRGRATPGLVPRDHRGNCPRTRPLFPHGRDPFRRGEGGGEGRAAGRQDSSSVVRSRTDGRGHRAVQPHCRPDGLRAAGRCCRPAARWCWPAAATTRPTSPHRPSCSATTRAWRCTWARSSNAGRSPPRPAAARLRAGRAAPDAFVLEALNPDRRFTRASAAAHTLYEKSDPYHLPGPGGVLDLEDCVFTELGDGRVEVRGSRHRPTTPYCVKLEGARKNGCRGERRRRSPTRG